MPSSDPVILPHRVILADGALHEDGWIGRELSLKVGPAPEGTPVLCVIFWNPDFAPALSQNRLDVKFRGMQSSADRIGLDQMIKVWLEVPQDEACNVTFEWRMRLKARLYDPRERAAKLVRVEWLPNAPDARYQ
jgi:hypothetical protein